MILWLLLGMTVISLVGLSVQTFRLQEREMFIAYQRRVIKQMERNDIVAKEFNEFLAFHEHIRGYQLESRDEQNTQ